MRSIVLLSLLMLTACTIRQESFAPSNDEAPNGASFTPANLNNPTGDDADRGCPGSGFAQGSRIDQYRDGTANLFCD
jgi:hypothetical protein